uniref:Uncharacterized protein n=1 Tax=uncultured Desulfobacterium sp. TaxID=201089 RepID=E1YER1_9BACT|nr:unknown protein [uncultured Desulfobacterium sp.]
MKPKKTPDRHTGKSRYPELIEIAGCPRLKACRGRLIGSGMTKQVFYDFLQVHQKNITL